MCVCVFTNGQLVTDPSFEPEAAGNTHTHMRAHALTVFLSGLKPLLTSVTTVINCLVTDRKTISATGSGPKAQRTPADTDCACVCQQHSSKHSAHL